MPRDSSYAGVTSIFRSDLEAGRRPQVFEDGRQLRDFVHVLDVAAANVRALGAARAGTFNISSGSPASVLEMAEALSAAMGSGLAPEITGSYRPGDVRHVMGSPELAADVLDWRATIELENGMKELVSTPLRA
jgi:dTDP-L-rhamnose 4-epimerase